MEMGAETGATCAAGAAGVGPDGALAGGTEDGVGGEAAGGAQATMASTTSPISDRPQWVAILPPVRRLRSRIVVHPVNSRAAIQSDTRVGVKRLEYSATRHHRLDSRPSAVFLWVNVRSACECPYDRADLAAGGP